MIFFFCKSDKLKEAGIDVWVETYDLGGGANVFSKVGQAVVDAKVGFAKCFEHTYF